MNMLYWNIRGIGNSESRTALKNLYLTHKPMLIFITEPKINFAHIPTWYWPTIGITKYCLNNRGSLLPNLWALWGNDLLAMVIFVSDQCIAMEISCFQSTVYIAIVYASTYYIGRQQLWADLTHLQGCFQGPWLFIGKNVRGQGMTRFQSKLRNVKNALKIWNRTVFGDVDRQVRLAIDEVNRIQQLIDSEGFSDQLYTQDLEA